MKLRALSIVSLAAIILAAHAGAESLVNGSVEAGKAQSTVCSACHGQDGNSVNPLWPNLAGQHATYIVAQLATFREGGRDPASAARTDPLMTPQALQLSDDDIANLAVYFESMPAPAMSVADASTVDKGEALYRGGDADKGVPACFACHGPAGRGNPAAGYPSLKGQHATYTAKQLRAYATGSRQSDGKTRIMRDIASRLSEDEIIAVASYVQGLR
jgi:cbb3-type cytochrome c oxidase subunit III